MCRSYFWLRLLQGQGFILRQTHCRVRTISFKPLVGFKNNSSQMSSMMNRLFVLPRSCRGQCHSSRLNMYVWLRPFNKFNNSDYLFNKSNPMLQRMVYSSLTVTILVYDPIFLKKTIVSIKWHMRETLLLFFTKSPVYR